MNPLMKLVKLAYGKKTEQVLVALGNMENVNTCNVMDNKLIIHVDNGSLYQESLLRKTTPFSIKQTVNVITLDYGISSYFIALLINTDKVNY